MACEDCTNAVREIAGAVVDRSKFEEGEKKAKRPFVGLTECCAALDAHLRATAMVEVREQRKVQRAQYEDDEAYARLLQVVLLLANVTKRSYFVARR